MSDDDSLKKWMQDWESLQRQYQAMWSEFAPKPPPLGGLSGANPFAAFASPPAATGWPEGMQWWSRLFAAGDKPGDAIERAMSAAQTYLTMLQSLSGTAAAPAAGAGFDAANPTAWFDSLRKSATAAGVNPPGVDASWAAGAWAKIAQDFLGAGQGFAELPAAFAPFFDQLRDGGAAWLRAPAFGLSREHQERHQKMALAFVEYQQAQNRYLELMGKVGQRGFELFQTRLTEPGRAPDSPRAQYDLWVDAVEEIYANVAMSEEFAKVYGELANAQMRVRAQVQAEVERLGAELGMPTRSELNTLHQRVRDLRAELRNGAIQAPPDERDAEIAALREAVRELKNDLDRARRPSSSSAPSPAANAVPPRARPAPVPRARAAPRRPPPVVVPRAAKPKEKPQGSFGDALAAMRQRVAARTAQSRAPGKKSAHGRKKHR